MKAWMPQQGASSRDPSRPAASGPVYEDHALTFLRSRGLKLIERNFSCRCGEIDLVMLDAQMLVFVEVKYRRQGRHGEAAEQVTARKREKLVNSALVFLSSRSQYANFPCRFDVVAISPNNGEATVNWIANAFDTN